jgi:hypothetical protein
MDYRDERDALRARVESLEGEVASTRAELERMRATENALGAARRENEKLRSEVRRLTGKGSRSRTARPAALVSGGVLCAVTIGGLVMGAARWRMSGDQGPSPRPSVQAGAAERPPEGLREVTATWSARVGRAEGLPFDHHAPCTLRAKLKSDGREHAMPDVEVACSGKALYRSSDQLEGVSSMRHNVEEAPGPEAGSYRAALSFEDQGTRTGERAQASIHTSAGVVVVWKDTAPAYRVELEVDELSAPWEGRALLARNERLRPDFRAVIERAGRVSVVNDFGLVTPEMACSVRVRPAFGRERSCRVAVRCGAATLYGAELGGFAACTAEGGRPIVARDASPSEIDRDPVVEVNLAQGTVEVSDTRPNAWSVKIELDRQN